MILVTTPTGDIGSRVLSHLKKSRQKLRVIVRDPSRLSPETRGRVDVVTGSHSDRASLHAALQGVNSIFWLPPGNVDSKSAHSAYVEFSNPLCELLPDSTVRNVVSVSALGRGWHKPGGLAEASQKMDEQIASTGVHLRALACGSLMGNILRQLDPIKSTGTFYAPTPGDLKLPHVAQADVAQVAIDLLTKPDWSGFEDVPLCGPEEISFNEMAKTLSEVLGTSVAFQEMSMSAFEGMMQGNGATSGMASDYVDMMVAKNEGMDTMLKDVDRSLTPTSFRKWCETEFKPAYMA